MKQQFKYVVGLFVAFNLLNTNAHAIEVTVYNQNLGYIKETREFNLKRGISQLHITDVPSQIDATSVHFKSLTDPEGTSVLEQKYQYELVSQEKIRGK